MYSEIISYTERDLYYTIIIYKYPTIREYSLRVIKMEIYLTAIIRKENPVYTSWCPELNVASQAKTIEKAIANLREAIELYFEDEDAYVPEEVVQYPEESPMMLCINVKAPPPHVVG